MQDMVTVNGNPMAMGDCDGNRVGVLVIRANQWVVHGSQSCIDYDPKPIGVRIESL